MLSRHLYALLFALLVDPLTAHASDAQSSLLGNALGRSGQVKSVLEHEPVKEPACKQFVRPSVHSSPSATNLLAAHGTNRDDTVRLRER